MLLGKAAAVKQAVKKEKEAKLAAIQKASGLELDELLLTEEEVETQLSLEKDSTRQVDVTAPLKEAFEDYLERNIEAMGDLQEETDQLASEQGLRGKVLQRVWNEICRMQRLTPEIIAAAMDAAVERHTVSMTQ